VRAAADVLRELGKSKNARTVAVLGDMRELGEGSPELHFSVGKYIKESGVSLLFTLGELAHNIADGARAAGMKDECIFTTDDKDDIERCGKALLSQLKENDIVLVKASLSINAPRVIKYLDEHINL
jgi:UDP-N-acetylmuramoyl-tripeptide--D-alanyl-D-alanine ligase